jgi:hypothetical protein
MHGGMWWDPETSGPESGWKLAFMTFLYCPRADMSLRCQQMFPGKEKCLYGQLSPLGTSYCPSLNNNNDNNNYKSQTILLGGSRGRIIDKLIQLMYLQPY